MEINNQTFRARHLAVTKNTFKNVTTKIDLYELTSKDKKFLEKLKDSVDFDKSLRDIQNSIVSAGRKFSTMPLNLLKMLAAKRI